MAYLRYEEALADIKIAQDARHFDSELINLHIMNGQLSCRDALLVPDFNVHVIN